MKELDVEIFKQRDSFMEGEKRIEMEHRLVEKQVHMVVKRFKRRHRHVMQDYHARVDEWRKRVAIEFKVHLEIVSHLRKVIAEQEVGISLKASAVIQRKVTCYSSLLTPLATTLPPAVSLTLFETRVTCHMPLTLQKRP
ncbi:hypothetical protein PoB_001167100 [Plakobranchus ocellatus]|uniref:Uncharacterized protein n=1 Tax=Plakobranchus ocellatus TaxID=259542 RepID=A0AAV3YS03_9GAST|nr:hypothetical protein PoB_001167100 [Plakobranchus ocellatus]